MEACWCPWQGWLRSPRHVLFCNLLRFLCPTWAPWCCPLQESGYTIQEWGNKQLGTFWKFQLIVSLDEGTSPVPTQAHQSVTPPFIFSLSIAQVLIRRVTETKENKGNNLILSEIRKASFASESFSAPMQYPITLCKYHTRNWYPSAPNSYTYCRFLCDYHIKCTLMGPFRNDVKAWSH